MKRPLHATSLDILAADVGISIAAFRKVAAKLGSQVETGGQRPLDQVCHESVTQYGPLLTTLSLDVGEEKPLLWSVASPFALLYKLGDINAKFMPFLHSYLKGGGQILLYTDETHPGNPLHFANGLKVQCYYWTFNELPDWWTRGTHGWMPLGFSIYCHSKVVGGVCFRFSF